MKEVFAIYSAFGGQLFSSSLFCWLSFLAEQELVDSSKLAYFMPIMVLCVETTSAQLETLLSIQYPHRAAEHHTCNMLLYVVESIEKKKKKKKKKKKRM